MDSSTGINVQVAKSRKASLNAYEFPYGTHQMIVANIPTKMGYYNGLHYYWDKEIVSLEQDLQREEEMLQVPKVLQSAQFWRNTANKTIFM